MPSLSAMIVVGSGLAGKFESLSGIGHKKTEFFYSVETHKTIVKYGGRGGIRTHGSLATTSDFESDAFNHSATLPLSSILLDQAALVRIQHSHFQYWLSTG